MLSHFNKYENKGNDVPRPKIEVIYASNDRSEPECLEFLNKQRNWASFDWNDHRIGAIRQEYGLYAVPTVLVFDRNLRLVTREAADDLINLSTGSCRNYWVDLLT